MKEWTTKNGYRIIQILSGRSNAYLVLKDKFVILIDTGKESEFERILKNICFLELSVNCITHLVLTHTHFDHCQLAKKIKDISLCKIIVSHFANIPIRNGYTEIPKGTTFITRLLSKLGRSIGKRKFGYTSFKPDILLQGDYVLNGTHNQIKIFETPGHSGDSVSVIIDDDVAIVGDLLFGIFKNSVFPPFADNIPTMIKSWNSLLNTGCNVFLPGHGREINKELLNKQYDKYSRKYNIPK
jgi:glyoxylase-like metal-dependent hydrolase (beta-lactamase superfamily II)